jgi:penicillin-binding protein 2
MIDPVGVHERRPPITPQLALRVAILGGIAFVFFAIVFFRLWYLQVLSGDQYLQQARDNRVRELRVQAPRGDILDRNDHVLVENRAATVVQLDPESLPAAERNAAATWGQQVTARSRRPKGKKGDLIAIPPPATAHLADRFRSLARVLNMSPKTIQERVVQSLAALPYANVTVKVDVDVPRRNYLVEHPEGFPGIDVERKFLRRYPQHDLAAQLVGSIGEIDGQELKQKRFKGVKQGTVVGQGGLERAYDGFLRGVDGTTKVTIDALGRPKGSAAGHDPVPGRSVRTTLDADLQQTGEKYLDQTINQGTGTAGGFVALDPRDGSVLALGSYPTVNPAILSKPFSQATADRLFGDSGGAPLFNRAIGGSYPTGSTFKPITALAAMSTGVVQPGDIIDDTGCIKIGTAGQEACNAGKEALGPVNMTSALSKSSDVYFYTMGQRLNALAGQPLQKWARRLGLGHRTGIDTPGEFGGTMPDRAWRDRLNRQEAACRKKQHISPRASAAVAFADGCGIADGENRQWTEGDEVNLAVGQGDLQATPLQMAVAYSTLANGNHRVRPHLGAAVEDSGGRLLQRIEPGAAQHVTIDPAVRGTILDGLHDATIHGTSADVWKGWNQDRFPVFGKTGTAQRIGHANDQSWYVCFVMDRGRPIVVAVTVEDGGWGAEAAAPIARTIVSKWYGEPIKFIAGKSHTL